MNKRRGWYDRNRDGTVSEALGIEDKSVFAFTLESEILNGHYLIKLVDRKNKDNWIWLSKTYHDLAYKDK